MPWVSLKALHDQTGLAPRTLQYIRAQEPGVLVTRERAGRTEYKQPDCATNLLRRAEEKAKQAAAQPSFAETRNRAMLAEAQLKELELARQLGLVVANDVLEETVRAVGDRLRAVLVNLPGTFGLRLEGLGVAAHAAEAVLEDVALELTAALRAEADELEADAAEIDRIDDDTGAPPADDAVAGPGTPSPAESESATGRARAPDDDPDAAQDDVDRMGGPLPSALARGVRPTGSLAHRAGPVPGRHHGRDLGPDV